VPSVVIAAIRLTLAALVLLPIALLRGRTASRSPPPRALRLTVASGALLALHFWSWIASLEFTSVASSTILVTTNPIWVALASLLWLGERPSRAALIGIAVALFGTLFTFGGEDGPSIRANAATFGNALALIGALAASGYLLIGRAVRDLLPLLTYVALAYSTAAALLWVAVLATSASLHGFSAFAWLALILLALGPQLIGHTAFNFALRHMSAPFVALSILGEPIGAAFLAWLLFGERFSSLQFIGFALLLIGIFLAARGETRSHRAAQPGKTARPS